MPQLAYLLQQCSFNVGILVIRLLLNKFAFLKLRPLVDGALLTVLFFSGAPVLAVLLGAVT